MRVCIYKHILSYYIDAIIYNTLSHVGNQVFKWVVIMILNGCPLPPAVCQSLHNNYIGWLDFMVYQPLEVCQIHFYTNNQFYFKQFNLTWVHSLIVKTFLFQTIHFIQTVLIQRIQLSISIHFVYSQLNIKTIQFNLSTVSMSKTVQFQTIQFSIQKQL